MKRKRIYISPFIVFVASMKCNDDDIEIEFWKNKGITISGKLDSNKCTPRDLKIDEDISDRSRSVSDYNVTLIFHFNTIVISQFC